MASPGSPKLPVRAIAQNGKQIGSLKRSALEMPNPCLKATKDKLVGSQQTKFHFGGGTPKRPGGKNLYYETSIRGPWVPSPVIAPNLNQIGPSSLTVELLIQLPRYQLIHYDIMLGPSQAAFPGFQQ